MNPRLRLVAASIGMVAVTGLAIAAFYGLANDATPRQLAAHLAAIVRPVRLTRVIHKAAVMAGADNATEAAPQQSLTAQSVRKAVVRVSHSRAGAPRPIDRADRTWGQRHSLRVERWPIDGCGTGCQSSLLMSWPAALAAWKNNTGAHPAVGTDRRSDPTQFAANHRHRVDRPRLMTQTSAVTRPPFPSVAAS